MSHRDLIFDTARQTLEIEAVSLRGLRDSLDERFANVVEAVLASRGRLVVSGIGKSALVARKLVATFNSTGTPALFMHAGDAIHGDLGMIQAGDLVMCLSKSGETAEMRALVPLVRQLGHPLIAVVARADCFLALQADYTLLTPIAREADPHNLAPTASAIVQMALGDALATALLAVRGFRPEDFAQFHPGGSLGKQLYLRLHDLGCRNARPRVPPTANLREVILEITGKRLGATAVCEPGTERLLGVVTDGDLRRMLARESDTGTVTAGGLMTPAPQAMHDQELAIRGLELVQAREINQLLLVDARGAYTGMVHLHDFIREGLG